MPTITALTCTFDRPIAFAMAECWMSQQTRKPDHWLVLDDSTAPVTCTQGQQHVYIPQFRGPGSMTNKIRYAIENKLITGDIIAVIEDDDAYLPGWLAFCEQQLARFDLIGEGRNLYYNVQHRWWFDHGNMAHSSLCATAMTKRMIPFLHKECIRSSDPWIDDRLWKNCRLPKKVFDPHALGRRLTIGIKAMPGRKGYGSGHDKDCGWAIRDPAGLKLVELLGADATRYTPFYELPQPKKFIVQVPALPTIEVHLIAYNEEEIMPYTLRHYKTFASRIIVHDGGSTDRTKAICEEMGAEVEHWETGGQINDELLRILKETCWAGTSANWVIVADADEFLYFPKGVEATLKAYDALRIPVARCHGFEMESPAYPTTPDQIYVEVNHGAPDDRWYGKPVLIRPDRVTSIHYAHGAHECVVTIKNGRRIPNPRVPHQPPVYLLHYHHLGSVERVGARYDGNKSRFSDVQKKHGWGWQGDGLVHSKQKRTAILANRRKVI